MKLAYTEKLCSTVSTATKPNNYSKQSIELAIKF